MRKYFWLLPFLCGLSVAHAQAIDVKQTFHSFRLGSQFVDTTHQHVYILKVPGVAKFFEYNTVEGAVVHINGSVSITSQNKVVLLSPDLRYGFNDQQLKASGELVWMHGSFITNNGQSNRWSEYWSLSGGRTIRSLYDHTPVPALMNSLQTLLYKRNLWKLYERRGLQLTYAHAFRNGYSLESSIEWQDRVPLENTSNFSLFHQHRTFTPNFPTSLLSANFQRHQVAGIGLLFQYKKEANNDDAPQKRPNKLPLPNYHVGIHWSLPSILGSDLNYGKWECSVWDSLLQKDHAVFAFRIRAGAFWNQKRTAVQDYFHFNENEVLLSGPYLKSFQLASYYSLSTTDPFFEVHLEQHAHPLQKSHAAQEIFGSIVPVVATNILLRQNRPVYTEYSIGLDQLFNFFRLDLVSALQSGHKPQWGVRMGLNFAMQ